jgi:Protein of unknown function (DUF1552)
MDSPVAKKRRLRVSKPLQLLLFWFAERGLIVARASFGRERITFSDSTLAQRKHTMFRTRREMMKLVGVAPFLASTLRSVFAADTAPLKRMVIMMRYNGAPNERWFPKNFNDFTGSCLASLSDPKIKSRLNVIKSMTNTFAGDPDGHATGAMGSWVARAHTASGISLDQYIVNKMNFPTKRRNLALGVYSRGYDSITNTFFKSPGSAADINDDPYDAINKVFADFTTVNPGESAAARLRKKKSILDAIKDDIGRISKNLVGAEKQKLEAHLAFVRSAELSLGATMDGMPPLSECKKLEPPGARNEIHDLAKLPDIARIQMDLVTMAMACDVSRIFVIQILSSYTNVGGGDVDLPWCGANIGRDANSGFRDGAGNPVLSLHQYHHSKVSDLRERAIFANINSTYATLFGELMKKLDAVPDGSGTLLDNSISVLASEYGGDSHGGADLPYLLGGGGGGFWKTNQMFDAGGASHTQLLGTLLEYFGIEDGTGKTSTDFGDRSRGLSYASFAGLKK